MCTVLPTYIFVGLVEILFLVMLDGDVQLCLDCSDTGRKLTNPLLARRNSECNRQKQVLLRWRNCEAEEIRAYPLFASCLSENIYYRRSILVDSCEVIFHKSDLT